MKMKVNQCLNDEQGGLNKFLESTIDKINYYDILTKIK